MKRRLALFAALAVLLTNLACTLPETTFRFIEPINNDGESVTFPVPTSANQAADAERLDVTASRITDVRYSIESRHTAFLLAGDLAEGLPGSRVAVEGLQLPALAPGEDERTVNVREFDPEKWRSVRVYDRGMCSELVPWEGEEGLAQTLAQGLADTMNAQSAVRGVRLLGGVFTPMLRADFPTNEVQPPTDADGFRLELEIYASDVTGGPVVCEDAWWDVELELWLEQTDRAYQTVPRSVVALTCMMHERLEDFVARHDGERTSCGLIPPSTDGRWAVPSIAKRFVSIIRDCARGMSNVIDGAVSVLEDTLEDGRQPTCHPDAHLGFSYADSDWVLRARREFNGRERGEDKQLLIGLRTIDGHRTGGHDALAHLTSVRIARFSSTNCGAVRRNLAAGIIRAEMQNALVLGVSEAIRSSARVDAASLFLIPRRCATDQHCDWRSNDGPAYQDGDDTDGEDRHLWQGARHVCKLPRPDPEDPNACPVDPGPLDQNGVCRFQFEPDHLNFRPDGLEVVLDWDANLDEGSEDPQSAFYRALVILDGARGLMDPPNQCSDDRDGALSADDSPLPITTPPQSIDQYTARVSVACPGPDIPNPCPGSSICEINGQGDPL